MLPSAGAAPLHRPVQRWRGNPVDTALLFHDGEFPLWVYYNFVIKISRKKHTQPPSSPSFGEGRASVDRETSIWDWAARTVREKYMSGRGRKKKKEEEEGEQIKSCQMEILGFKRSETGVRVCLLFKSSLCDANSNKLLCFANDLFSVRFLLDEFSRFSITLGGGGGTSTTSRRPSTTPSTKNA